MSTAWLGGLAVRRTGRGQVPVADLFCARCSLHRRVTGRERVADFMRANPLIEHRAVCPATTTERNAA